MSAGRIEMPRYRCTKVVQAIKIRTIAIAETGGELKHVLFPFNQNYSSIEVSDAYISRHRPHAGGYYVVYNDGYESFSPAGPFEEGYTRLEAEDGAIH